MPCKSEICAVNCSWKGRCWLFDACVPMKGIFKTTLFEIVFAVLLLFVPLFIAAKISDYRRIDLGKIKWVVHPKNSSSLYFGNACLLERCGISLWADYPYVYGFYRSREKAATFFIIDLRAATPKILRIADSRVPYEFQKRNLDHEKLTTFWSLKGQWGDSEKLSALKRGAVENIK